MIVFCFFFSIKTTQHLDIRRDMKKFSSVGCCIDKRKKKSGYRQNKIHRMIKREHLSFLKVIFNLWAQKFGVSGFHFCSVYVH